MYNVPSEAEDQRRLITRLLFNILSLPYRSVVAGFKPVSVQWSKLYFYDQGLCFTNISLLLFVASSVLHWKCGRAQSTQRWAGDNDQSMYQTSYLTVLNCVTRVGMLWHFIFITLANSSAPHNIHPAPHHHHRHLPTADVRSHWHWLLKEKGRSRLVPSLRQKKERKMQSKQQQQQKGEKLTVFQSIFQGQAVWR